LLAQVDGLYPWPYDGPWAAKSAALVVVDMQRDFLDPRGWLALTGGDCGPLASVVPAVRKALLAARQRHLFTVFTVEAHRADLSDLPANKLWRSQRLGAAIGTEGPLGRHLVRDARGADIAPQLAPAAGEPIVAKPGKSAFIATDLDHLLRGRGICNLVFAGITTDGAVHNARCATPTTAVMSA
jgi:nicotinamidase-related amidase